MKKSLLTLLSVLITFGLNAQKSNLVVGEISNTSGISSRWCEVLRSNIISGLTKSARLIVTDGRNISGLPVKLDDAVLKLRETGADCLLTAQINSFTNKIENGSDGKTWYKTTLEYTATVINVNNGSIRGTKKETHYGSSTANYEEAYSDALSLVANDMVGLTDDFFRVQGEIKALAETHPKKGVRTLYVGIGSEVGISAGNILEVFKEVDIAGETISEKIGEVKAKEVKSGTLTLCTVTKGGKEILEAYDNQLKLIVVSRPPKDPLSFLSKAIDAL